MTDKQQVRKFLQRASNLVQSRSDEQTFLELATVMQNAGLINDHDRHKMAAKLQERLGLEYRTNGDYEEVFLNGRCIAADNNIQGNEMLEAIADALGYKVKTTFGDWEWDGKENHFVPDPPKKAQRPT